MPWVESIHLICNEVWEEQWNRDNRSQLVHDIKPACEAPLLVHV